MRVISLKSQSLRAKAVVFALFVCFLNGNASKQVIAETQVPVRATVQTMADTAGGTRKVVNVESKSLGEVFQNLEARAKQVLSSGAEDAARVKPISLPAFEKLTIRVEADGTPHLISNHKVDGKGYLQSLKDGGKKDVFPAWMTENQILSAVKKAYKNAKKVGTQIDFETGTKKVILLGDADGMKVKMYVNLDLKELETAFPQ